MRKPFIEIESPVYKNGYEAGKVEGRRLERRALERKMRRQRKVFADAISIVPSYQYIIDFIDKKFLVQRTKPAKRKEGR